MTTIPIRFRNALNVRTEVVIEIPAADPARRSWVQIIPQRNTLDDLAEREGWRRSEEDRDFIVRVREIARTHIAQGWDVAPGDGLWDLARADVHGIRELEVLLQSWGVNVAAMEYSADSDFPL